MTDTIRWWPPLPSCGKKGGAPVCLSRNDLALHQKMQEFYTERRSVADLFEVRMSPRFLEKIGLHRQPLYLSQYSPSEQVHILLSSLWFKASDNFKMKLRISLQKRNGLSRIRQWYHTANGIVLPYLISGGEDYQTIDRLTRFALENCASNYSHFIKEMKTLKKAMRKSFALGRELPVPRHLRTYYSVFKQVLGNPRALSSPGEWGRMVLLWTQTRASGLADGKMLSQSVEKFCSTVTTPCKRVVLDQPVLVDCVRGALGVSPDHARISVGTTSCLESTRAEGGKSRQLRRLCRSTRLHTKYNFVTLEPTKTVPRPATSSEDVVHWAVQTALERPCYVRTARLHCVAEPSKARTITVASYAYQVIMGVFAHVFQATLKSAGVRSGLTRDRHLWRFLTDTMNPQSSNWDSLRPGEVVWSLSTDLSEATDYGNPMIARQVWWALIHLAKCHPQFPIGLAVLAMNLYCGKRYIIVPSGNGFYRYIATSRGWFMGDMMTKVILTIVHDYSMRISRIAIYSLVGDDEVSLSNEKGRLVAHLKVLTDLDFKVSRDDTFISRRLMFYCEEGALVPQSPVQATHVEMRRNMELGYLDYPRIRLLLAETSETDNYSMTNIGRFSLLGKETRWVHNVNRKAIPLFLRAGLLQHILIPQDKDTLCPYTPLEIGGDGAYTPDTLFLHKVVEDKCRDPQEAKYRIISLLKGQSSFKFVRSDRLNEVVHKHHLLLPVLEEVKRYLPPESVITPMSETHRILLESVRVRGLERPQQTWLRLCRGFYYKRIFEGGEPPVPSFAIERQFSGGSSEELYPDYATFVRHWANPGFKFANHEPYFVRRDLADKADPLHLPWVWSDLDTLKYPSAFSIFSSWMEQDVTLEDRALDDVIALITRNRPLPDRVVKRLNLFMESDNYILSQCPKTDIPDHYGIVTRDIKLCARVALLLSQRRGQDVFVYALDPLIYLTGGLANGILYHSSMIPKEDYTEMAWVEDPGAILHVDYTEFTDGFPHDETIYDSGYSVYRTSTPNVAVMRFGKDARCAMDDPWRS